MDSADTDSAEHWAHQEKLLGKHVHVQVQLRKVIKAMKNVTAYFLQYHFCRVQTFLKSPTCLFLRGMLFSDSFLSPYFVYFTHFKYNCFYHLKLVDVMLALPTLESWQEWHFVWVEEGGGSRYAPPLLLLQTDQTSNSKKTRVRIKK